MIRWAIPWFLLLCTAVHHESPSVAGYPTLHATIDRVTDGRWIVFHVGPSDREWVVPVTLLASAEGLTEGVRGRLEVTECSAGGPSKVSFVYEPDATEWTRRRLQGKLDLLRQRRPAAIPQATPPTP